VVWSDHRASLGYRLDADGQSFVYSGDTGPCRALAELAEDCDVLDRPGMRERVLREVCEIFNGDVYFGEHLMEVPFSPPFAAKLD
jgi:ribonuclease Z